MAVMIDDHATSNFNSLNDYVDVLPKFDSLKGDILVPEKFKDLFRRYNVENILGLSLLTSVRSMRENASHTSEAFSVH